MKHRCGNFGLWPTPPMLADLLPNTDVLAFIEEKFGISGVGGVSLGAHEERPISRIRRIKIR
jgi:hypothetical protein